MVGNAYVDGNVGLGAAIGFGGASVRTQNIAGGDICIYKDRTTDTNLCDFG